MLAAALGATALAGCGGSTTTTVINTSGQPSSAGGAQASAHPQIFHGNGQQSLGTITVPADTTISWNCPSCGNTNFIINNAKSDPNQITTNGLNQTQGVDTLPAGVYHTVVVNTTGGPWTIAIGTTAPAPSGTGAPASNGAQSSESANNGQSCGGGLSVGPNTSCPFAQNVENAYHAKGGPGTLQVYSPVTGQTYTMTCDLNGSQVTCTGGNNASVYFSL